MDGRRCIRWCDELSEKDELIGRHRDSLPPP